MTLQQTHFDKKFIYVSQMTVYVILELFMLSFYCSDKICEVITADEVYAWKHVVIYTKQGHKMDKTGTFKFYYT